MYNEKVIEIFKNPHNVGELKDANAVGQVGNVSCGDIMKIFLKINEDEVIEDASFKTFGCAAAIVSSSIATDLIKGMTIKQALELDNDKIIDIAGGLPVHKVHCSVLAKEAIEDAVKNYYKRKAKEEKQGKKVKAVKQTKKEVKETKEIAKQQELNENKQENIQAKSLLSGLKLAKASKSVQVKQAEKTSEKNEKINKKETAKKEKNAKKIDKNFKNLSSKLNKLIK